MNMVRVTAIGRKGGVPNSQDKVVLLCGIQTDGSIEPGEWMGYHVGENGFRSPFIIGTKTVYYGFAEESYTETTNIGERKLKIDEYFSFFRPSPDQQEFLFQILSCHEYHTPPAPTLRAQEPKKKRLPTLLALPIKDFTSSSIAISSGPRNPLKSRGAAPCKVDFPENPSIVLAIDSLRAVIELTLFFLKDGPPTTVTPIAEWLGSLKGELENLEDELVYMSKAHVDSSMDVPDLYNFLYEEPSIKIIMELENYELSNLLDFWLKEVHRRAEELYDICIMSVDCVDAENAFLAVSNLRYPLK
ncbi:MAG: hypothetical protein Q8O64_16780 [Sideroxyarcus sp.]|nr:hypothetical protein [Sideroxyarcus sp.]